MSVELPPFGDRRAPLPPAPLLDELPRTRLVEALAARFDAKVTVVVAGAGFGKTTALAQAIRANQLAPRGIDAWVGCEPGDEDPGRIAAAIVSAAGGGQSRGGATLARVLTVLRDASPATVCLVIDDLHELPNGSAAEQLMRDLVARLPNNVHLLVASRQPVPLPLARLRAAGQVVEVGPDDLAFTESEIGALADVAGEDRSSCEGLAGWPSLVRLVLSAPPGAARQFIWEEILAELSPVERACLLALAVLGSGSAAEVGTVAECDPALAEQLVLTVPLLHTDAQGRLGAHHLWEETIERIYPSADVRRIRLRALAVLHERGETIRLGSSAVRWAEPAMFRVAAVRLVRDSLGALPIDTAARWLDGSPAQAIGTPEHRLLSIALRFARDRNDDLDAEIDAVAGSFEALGDNYGHAVTLALASVASHSKGNTIRLIQLAQRIRRLPGALDVPLLRFFVGAVDAAIASLAGDVDGSLQIIESLSSEGVPVLPRELVTRLHVVMLALAGRADEAVSIAKALHESPHPYVRAMPSMMRWLAGDPSQYLTTPPSAVPFPNVNHADRLAHASLSAVVAASIGDAVLVASSAAAIRQRPSDIDARASTFASVANAYLRIVDHDEQGARDAIAQHLARHSLSERLVEAHLRRHLAVPFICDPTVRRQWSTAALGPTHRKARAVAQQFLLARDGELDTDSELESASALVTALPLPWSVELAVRARVARCRSAGPLIATLWAWLPQPVRAELDWLASNGDAGCQVAAIEILRDVPNEHQQTLHIAVLGPMQLHDGDSMIDRPELRRGRVRTLLTLLTVRGRMRRSQICDVLWPESDPTVAAQNLRVTLSRLRRLIEPATPSGSAERLLVVDDTIALAGTPLVDSDLERFQTHIDQADEAYRLGDTQTELLALDTACDLWRGDPVVDLAELPDLAGDTERVTRSVVDASLRLGELLLVAGRLEDSLRRAERCRNASPYSERAHRLAIACHLQRDDSVGLRTAVKATLQMLDDLGVAADTTTDMLLRQAAIRLRP